MLPVGGVAKLLAAKVGKASPAAKKIVRRLINLILRLMLSGASSFYVFMSVMNSARPKAAAKHELNKLAPYFWNNLSLLVRLNLFTKPFYSVSRWDLNLKLAMPVC